MKFPRSAAWLALLLCAIWAACLGPQAAAQEAGGELDAADAVEEVGAPSESAPDTEPPAAAPAAPSQAPPPASAGALDLSKLQSEKLRDPFWPVNYEPPPPEPKTPAPQPGTQTPATPAPVVLEEPRWDEALKTMVVKGVMKVAGGKYVAMIGAKVVGEGETVCTEYRGRKYCWKIGAVSERGVNFQRLELEE